MYRKDGDSMVEINKKDLKFLAEVASIRSLAALKKAINNVDEYDFNTPESRLALELAKEAQEVLRIASKIIYSGENEHIITTGASLSAPDRVQNYNKVALIKLLREYMTTHIIENSLKSTKELVEFLISNLKITIDS